MASEPGFPWKAVVFAGAVAIGAGAIALLSVLTLLAFMNDHGVVELNGHLVGGPADRAVAIALALFFGTIAIVALLTCRRLVAGRYLVKDDARAPR